jgi:uncharacterized protein (TIGR04255 family)
VNQEDLLLPLPDLPRIQLPHPPLRAVVCQIQYEGLGDIEDPAVIAPLRKAISDSYPKVSAQQRSVQIQMNQTGVSQQVNIQWVFADAEDRWSLVVAPDFLAVETRGYQSFDEFRQQVERAVNLALEHLKPSPIIKLGLRYINEIRPYVESAVLRDLLGPVQDPVLGPELILSRGELHLLVKGNVAITVRHGWYPQGSTIRSANNDPGLAEPFYLLDIDTYQVFSGEPGAFLPVDMVGPRLDVYHRNIYRLFRWAISTDYLQRMVEKA